MKRLLRRYTMLMILILVAFGWVALLSIPYGEAGTMRAVDGANGRFTLVDEAAFPTITGYALLQDVGGKVIDGLQQDDFVLTEDGIPVDFTFTGAGEQPLTTMLVIDRSGSMKEERKMDGAIGAAQTFIDLLRPGRDTLGITTFSGDIETLLPIRALATVADQRAAGQLVEHIGPSGATRLNDAIIEAADDMQGTAGRRVIVALTDGVSDGDNASASDSINRALDAGIPVYTIGLGSDVDNEQLQRIAQQTGGAYYFAPDADELAALYANLARALQNEYSFTYQSPTPKLDGTRRTLELNVARANAPFTISDDYAVSGVLVLQRSPWLLFGLGGTLLVLGVAPSVLGRRRKVPTPAAVPATIGVSNVASASPVAPVAEPIGIGRHPYRTPLEMPVATAAQPEPRGSFTVMLRKERTTIGSEAGNDVVLPGLAPQHAAILRQEGRWVVTPAGGEIMVAYNGDAGAERRILGTNALKHGTVIRLGTLRAIFQAKDQPELLIEGA